MKSNEKLALLAPDLTKGFPRSPREILAGCVVAARTLDNCRAVLAGTAGEYHCDCLLDRTFFDFAEIGQSLSRPRQGLSAGIEGISECRRQRKERKGLRGAKRSGMAFQAMVRPLTPEFPFIPVRYETCVFSTTNP